MEFAFHALYADYFCQSQSINSHLVKKCSCKSCDYPAGAGIEYLRTHKRPALASHSKSDVCRAKLLDIGIPCNVWPSDTVSLLLDGSESHARVQVTRAIV